MTMDGWHGEWFGDATVNLGTKIGLLNATSLYEVHAIVNVANSSVSEKDCGDEITRKILTHGACIGIQQTVLVFSHDFQEMNYTFDFESDVICLHASENRRFLLVGETSGLISLLCLRTGNTIYNLNVMDQYCDRLVSCALSFSDTIKNYNTAILIATSTKLIRLRMDLEDDEEDCSEERVVVEDEIEEMEDCTFATFCRWASSSFLVVGDDGRVILIEDVSRQEWTPTYIPIPGDVIKVQATYDGRYLLVLDSSHCLYVICIRMGTIVKRWVHLQILEFMLLETVDQANGVVDNKLAVVLGGESHSLQICGFPNMTKLFQYTLNAQSCVTFAGAVVNEDIVHVMESKTENGAFKILVLGIYETLPEKKLLRLLSTKRIEEAENFASAFGLSNQSVAKAKVGVILEDLAAAGANENSAKLCDALKTNLNKIDDIHYVVEVCCKCPMQTLEHQKDILQYSITRLTKGDEEFVDENLAKNVFEELKRLEMYEMLLHASESGYGLRWEIFRDANLWDVFLKYVHQGNLSSATLLLERHLLGQELCLSHIDKLFGSIPERLSSRNLLVWLRHCVPLIVQNVPHAFNSIVQWVIQRSCNMEVAEMPLWPGNALCFLEGFIAMLTELVSDPGFDKCNIYFGLMQDSNSHLLMERCQEVACNLKDLNILQSIYKCKITFADYSEIDKKSVAFHLFDWMTPEMLKTFVPQFLLQFCQKHKLDINRIITDYIQDFMVNTEYGWWHWEEAPWEEIMKLFVDCINVDEIKCTAIHAILKQAPVPWSDGIQTLLKTAMNLGQESFCVQLREEIRIMGLKTVILKYGFKNHVISDAINAQMLVNYILTQDQPTAVEDAMKVVVAHCHIHVYDVYLFRMKQLTRLQREEEFVSLVKSFDKPTAQTCCNRFMLYVVKLLNSDPGPDSDENQEQHALFVRAAIFILSSKRSVDFFDESWERTFVKMLKLQAEFGIFLSVENYKSEVARHELLQKNVVSQLRNEAFASNPTVHICQILTGKAMSVPKQVTGNLYRLGDILGFSEDEVTAMILQSSVVEKKFETAAETCRKIIQCFPSVGNPKILWNSVRDILLQSVDENMFCDVKLCADLLSLMQTLLAYCESDMIAECLEMTVLISQACVMQKHLSRAEFSLPQIPLEYFQWTYNAIFKETGFSLHVDSISNFLSHSLQFFRNKDEQCANFLSASSKFCECLKQFSHSLQAFSTSCNSIKCSALAVIDFPEESSCDVILQINAESDRQVDFVSDIIRSIFSSQSVDVNLAYALLCSLPPADAMILLGLQERRCSYNFKKLCALGVLGMQISDTLHLPDKVLYFHQLWKKAVWSAKLHKYNLSFEDINDSVAMDDLSVQIGFVSPLLTKSYNECFNLDADEMLFNFLHVLLTSCQLDTATKIAALKGCSQVEIPCDILVKMAEFTISLTNVEECHLLDKLYCILPNVDPYNYEFLEFVLGKICNIDTSPIATKGFQIVRFLKVYQRISAPAQREINEWQSKYPGWPLPVTANCRLPFQAVMGENSWGILKPELTADTISIWLGVSNIIALPSDEMLMICGQNIVDSVSKLQKPIAEVNDELSSIVARMGNKEKAVALISSMASKLKPGGDKVQVAKLAVLFAFKWSQETNSESAHRALKRLSEQRLHIITEAILHKYNLTKSKYVSLIQYPHKLILSLYKDCQIEEGHLFSWCGNPDVHKACEEIGYHCRFDLQQIRFALAEKWLQNADSPNKQTTDLVQVPNIVHDANFKRAVYIFKNGPIEESVQFLSEKIAISSPENMSYKVRALRCLLAIADPITVQNICNETIDGLRTMFKLFVFAAEMERLHLRCDICFLDESRVLDILASLWRSHSNIPDAVNLMAQMLLHYKITSVKIWDVILPRMVEMKLWKMLKRIVIELSSSLNITMLTSYKSAWNFVLFSPFDDVVEEQFGIHIEVFSVLHICPHSVGLDFNTLAKAFLQAKLSALALDCILHIGNEDAMTKTLQIFFDNVDVRSVLDNWWKLKDSGVYIYHADKITNALYSWIDRNMLYSSVADSSAYMEALAAYTLSTGNIRNLAQFALQHDRCDDGIKLVKKYLEINPHLRISSFHGLSELDILKFLPDTEDALNIPKDDVAEKWFSLQHITN